MRLTLILTMCISAFLCRPIADSKSLQICDSKSPGQYNWTFKTAYIAELGDRYLLGNFKGRCFNKIYPSMVETDKSFEITLHATEAASWSCADAVIISSGKSSKLKLMGLQGHYKVSFDKYYMSELEQAHVRKYGMRIMKTCSDLSAYPRELYNFLKMFLGGFGTNPKIPFFGSKTMEYQIDANIKLLNDYLGYEVERRTEIVEIDIDKNKIKSGDFIGLTRMDGLDQFIAVASGSRLGHTTIAMWDESDGELYITESQAGWYWPRAGIQRNKWEDWYKWAKNADMNIMLIPMKEEHRKNFDIKKAWDRFYELQGYNYGFHNFLFSSVDTPHHSLPDVLDVNFVSIVFSLIETFIPSAIDTIVGEAWNKRLGTENLRIPEMYEEVYKQDTTIEDVMAIVEQEDWVYSDGPNYVCSCYVFTILKASGVFGDIQFQSQEQSPKDLYSMNIWDFSGENIPSECQEDTQKNNLKVCQLYGKIVLRLDDNPGYLEAYNNMGETCPSIGPDFKRTPGC